MWDGFWSAWELGGWGGWGFDPGAEDYGESEENMLN